MRAAPQRSVSVRRSRNREGAVSEETRSQGRSSPRPESATIGRKMTKSPISRASATAALLSLVLLTACGPSTEPDDGKLSIAVIPMGTTHEYWKSIHAGAIKASQELDVEIVWKGPQREDDRSQQIAVVEDMISLRVDGIVIAPLDRTGLRKPVAEAKQAGIPTVVIDSGLEGDEHISFVATNNRKGGVVGAQAARRNPRWAGQDHSDARFGRCRKQHGPRRRLSRGNPQAP